MIKVIGKMTNIGTGLAQLYKTVILNVYYFSVVPSVTSENSKNVFFHWQIWKSVGRFSNYWRIQPFRTMSKSLRGNYRIKMMNQIHIFQGQFHKTFFRRNRFCIYCKWCWRNEVKFVSVYLNLKCEFIYRER
jgi:hypothetical protein